ncbi:MAG: HemK/PrmC family methyltransferase [Burkholderiaceae bacterium]
MTPTIDTLIRASKLPRLTARALFEAASGRSREWLIAHGDEASAADWQAGFESLCRRFRDGEPLAYLVQWREFHGRRFTVGPAVLIPRDDTAVLVDWAIERAPRGGQVLEMATGSGIVAITLALARPDLGLTATDLSHDALLIASRAGQCARTHRRGDHLAGRVIGWWRAVPDQAFDLVLANPPYIASGDPHLLVGDLRHEPRWPPVSGDDGLEALREIIAGAAWHLPPGGWLLLEHGYGHDQGAAVHGNIVVGLPDIAGRAERCRGALAGVRRKVCNGRLAATGLMAVSSIRSSLTGRLACLYSRRTVLKEPLNQWKPKNSSPRPYHRNIRSCCL